MTVVVLLGLLIVLLHGVIVRRIRQRLAPRTFVPSRTPIVQPAESHWTALDDQQLARFVRDSSS